MVTDTEKLLIDRLKQIDLEIDALKKEKSKVKQSLGIFKGNGDNVNAPLLIQGEPIFKEKVKIALKDQYSNGATALELLEYLNSNWKRKVKRASLSPQLSRLKDEGVLTLKDNVWSLKSESPEQSGPSVFD